MMTKHLTSETLIDYLHRELSPPEDARVLAHLEECADCTRELNAEASITEQLRATARASELELPLGMRSAIMARIASQDTAQPGLLRRWLSPILLVPLAAAVAAAAFFFSPVGQPAQNAALPVSYYIEQHAAGAQESPLSDHGAIIMSSLSTPISNATDDAQGAR